MADGAVARNLDSMDELDFTGWNGADWDGATGWPCSQIKVRTIGRGREKGVPGSRSIQPQLRWSTESTRSVTATVGP